MTQGAPQPGGLTGWFQRVNKKILVGVVIVVVVVGSLMGTQLRGALTYYVTVDELMAKGIGGYGERVRVGGRVMEGTFQRDAANNVSFNIYHNLPEYNIPVRYRGIVPDIFREGGDVIVEGAWREDGIFYATNLLAQHPPEFKIADPGTPHPEVDR